MKVRDSSFSIIIWKSTSFFLIQPSFLWRKNSQTTWLSIIQKIFILTLCFTTFWYVLGLILDLIGSAMIPDWLNTRWTPALLDTIDKWCWNNIKRRGFVLQRSWKKRRIFMGFLYRKYNQHSFPQKVGHPHESSLVQPWFHSGHLNNIVYVSIYSYH